jgi:hypothetical protein
MERINIGEKFARFSEQWQPKIVAELNGQELKLVKVQGTFPWHYHDYADPPWPFRTYSAKGKGRSAEAHYDCMSLDEIAALPVSQWAAPRQRVVALGPRLQR